MTKLHQAITGVSCRQSGGSAKRTGSTTKVPCREEHLATVKCLARDANAHRIHAIRRLSYLTFTWQRRKTKKKKEKKRICYR